MRKIAVLGAAVMMTGSAVNAAHVWENPGDWWSGHFVYVASGPAKYTANELSLDTFASYTAPENKFNDLFDTSLRNGTWGGGVGLNYFLTRELGISVDANAPADDGNLVNSVAGSLVARLPFEQSGLAPYIFGGGGRSTEPVWEWTGHAGLGLEYRLNPLTGLFVDGRYRWADKVSDSSLFRAGVRFVF